VVRESERQIRLSSIIIGRLYAFASNGNCRYWILTVNTHNRNLKVLEFWSKTNFCPSMEIAGNEFHPCCLYCQFPVLAISTLAAFTVIFQYLQFQLCYFTLSFHYLQIPGPQKALLSISTLLHLLSYSSTCNFHPLYWQIPLLAIQRPQSACIDWCLWKVYDQNISVYFCVHTVESWLCMPTH